ncbi:uncharacterized protein LOC132045545 [Lycium ferocissimum]|uniref:uncharacterized protein LOC132045545 n=1 Tax=Lycium ferocissimum TaxID=112874 RepID=UPI002816948A|nr:uncharacterized protein LOC132045545 [Lycium ferocissimum]
MKFGKKRKLSPRDIGLCRILRRVSQVAYELELPQDLVAVHPVFRLSMLRKCMGNPTFVVLTDSIRINDSLTYERSLVEIPDRQVRKLRTKEAASVKVLWRTMPMERKATATQKGKTVAGRRTEQEPPVNIEEDESLNESPSQTSHALPVLEEREGASAPAPMPPVPPAGA